MAVNKVVYGGRTLIDLTSDTVTAETLAEGVTAHGANGELIVGTMVAGSAGYVVQATAPEDTDVLWVDSANGYILKFYDETSTSWKAIGSAWG